MMKLIVCRRTDFRRILKIRALALPAIFNAFLSSALLFSSESHAIQLTENFTTVTFEDTANTTLVWNLFFHMLHPPLVVDMNPGVADTEDFHLDVGNGSDGAFDIPTYANFSVGGVTPGNVITIDTSVHPVLQLTYFNLPSGWTIEGTGPNPLWFKVQGTFTNNGIIDCSGGNGGAVTPGNTSAVSAGGVGRCGGGAGGNGGSLALSATNGASGGSDGGTVTNTGGVASSNSAISGTYPKGGGGGGGYSAFPGTNGGPAGSGGAAGTCTADDTFLIFGNVTGGPGGGSGGAGGGAYTFIDGNQSSGGGGGGGGGVIRISTVGDVNVTGQILARGGNGGGAASAAGAGSGGAGGGGAVWIQSAGNFNDSGIIDSRKGTAGAVSAPGTGTGGLACEGRSWLIGLHGLSTCTGCTEAPSPNLALIGEVHFSTLEPYTAQSLPYDAGNTAPSYLSFLTQTSLPGTSAFSMQVAGSSDGFVTNNTGFVPLANISTLQGKRYFKFLVSLQGNTTFPGGYTPATLSSVNAVYNGVTQNQFNFSPACGVMSGPEEFGFWCFIFLLIFSCYQRKPKKKSPFV